MWLTRLPEEGEIVYVKNYNGRKWRKFRCEILPDKKALIEAYPGETRRLIGCGGYHVIGMQYDGLKRVEGESWVDVR